MPSFLSAQPKVRRHAPSIVVAAVLACGVSACTRDSSSIAYPADADIVKALQSNFTQDANSAKARELVKVLGGEQGQLVYKIRNVIFRQGVFEAQYDVSLRMGRNGAESLKHLYATMIPKGEAAKLTEQTLAAYAKWLDENAKAIEKTNAQQGAALRVSIKKLDDCYGNAKAGDSVPLMDGLSALVAPARDTAWYAEKLQSTQVLVRCLPV